MNSPLQQLNLPWWDDEPVASASEGAVRNVSSVAADVRGNESKNESTDACADAAAVAFSTSDKSPHSDMPQQIVADTAENARPLVTAAYRHPQATHEIKLGDMLVAFELKRLKRRSIGMYVGPDGLSVRAPRWVGWPEIEQTLYDKERWLCNKLHEQRASQQRQQAARVEWKEGGSIDLLGEPVILVLDPRVCGGQLNEEAQALPGVAKKTLHVGLPNTATPEQIRDVVNAWLQRKALEVFKGRVEHFAQALNVQVRSLKLSNAKTRWGSATSNGDIRLHWRLVQFSEAIIDYVVAHELAHLREMNHSPKFWDVVASVMPQYDQARSHLRSVVLYES
jgi:predicted metal-dependent hydrolase